MDNGWTERIAELEAENDELRAALKRETNEYIEASHSLAIERDAFKSARDRLREQVNATIELLECAKINVDNIKKGGVIFCELTKMQIDEAIKILAQALAGKESVMKKEASNDHT